MSKFRPRPPSNERNLNIALQNFHTQMKFTGFELKKEGKKWVWVGYLQPTPHSEKYKVNIVLHPYKNTKVFVLEPELLERAPHRYSDQSLCLYHPNDKSFNGETLIADTIIPWTCEWLFFYEGWLKDGVWWGKEAPHGP
ncbi:hypothetical protein [Metabacillus malikii]|uniref:Type II CBASS E2 protein domain-containing protein n=1 Tax=Metabacillus malikii TaxID=1504265 RepID=A0ABT9ZG30_9BACI|nr:hypothetical protein [Metabacillus malikii]MDQ0230940.1 hypothetical protein [Metabacillus malikii]